jgi:uncharacterized membrane protein
MYPSAAFWITVVGLVVAVAVPVAVAVAVVLAVARWCLQKKKPM